MKKDRYSTISEKSGYSIDIVKAILNAEFEYCVDELKKGKHAIIGGRSILIPVIEEEMRNGKMEQYIGVKSKASETIKHRMRREEKFNRELDENKGEKVPDILAEQISSLT